MPGAWNVSMITMRPPQSGQGWAILSGSAAPSQPPGRHPCREACARSPAHRCSSSRRSRASATLRCVGKSLRDMSSVAVVQEARTTTSMRSARIARDMNDREVVAQRTRVLRAPVGSCSWSCRLKSGQKTEPATSNWTEVRAEVARTTEVRRPFATCCKETLASPLRVSRISLMRAGSFPTGPAHYGRSAIYVDSRPTR